MRLDDLIARLQAVRASHPDAGEFLVILADEDGVGEPVVLEEENGIVTLDLS